MNQIASKPDSEMMERVLIGGDLSKLTAEQRVNYYGQVCVSVGLNPLTKPLEYISLNGKLTLYAKRDCTDQLRSIHKVSVVIAAREFVEGCYIVTARATNAEGRTDEAIGAVPIGDLKGEARANAMMKAETKAKRRVTLSICGMGMLDETEVSSIPGAVPVDMATGEVIEAEPTPEQRKAIHDELADKYADAIICIKDGIKEGDFQHAAPTWFELPEDVKMGLWLAPTKGGVFSTKERDTMKSKEFRVAHYGESNGNG